MPSRNERKPDILSGTYHVYNRGIDRSQLFHSARDYHRFIDQARQALDREPGVDLLVYCLMPNHLHLLIHQYERGAMARFMQRLSLSYVMYYNKRLKRIGPLFQGRYKARQISGMQDLKYTSRYIHRNPETAGLDWRQHRISSRQYYLDPRLDDCFVNTEPVLEHFGPGEYWEYLSTATPRDQAQGFTVIE